MGKEVKRQNEDALLFDFITLPAEKRFKNVKGMMAFYKKSTLILIKVRGGFSPACQLITQSLFENYGDLLLLFIFCQRQSFLEDFKSFINF